jgi:3-hydroxyisobutyrate dehydrogenase
MPLLNTENCTVDGWPGPVGFIGLGDMGGPMVSNLAAAGLDVIAYDRNPETLREWAAPTVTAAATCIEVGAAAEVICICVLTDNQVQEVVGELLQVARRGQILVVHSSVRPATIELLVEQAGEHGVALIDAAVSGTRTASMAGTLTMMVGGPRETIDRCLPMLSVVGKAIFHVGEAGHGQVVKMVNNMLFQTNHLIALEALRLSQSFDIDERDVMDVVQVSTGRSWITEFWGFHDELIMESQAPAAAEARYRTMTKEQHNALQTANDRGVSLPVTAVAVELLREMLAERRRLLQSRPAAEATAP